jgi:hypothetical protein
MLRTTFPILFLTLFGACNPSTPPCLKAKVLRVSCASFVVQVLNKDSVGSYGWKDISGNGVYNNVFSVANTCRIGKWSKGEEFYFTLVDSAQTSECMTCMMFDAPPEKTYMIENVSATCKIDE